MTTSQHKAQTLAAITDDVRRLAQMEAVRETFHASLERAGELFLAGLWFESRTVATEAIIAIKQEA